MIFEIIQTSVDLFSAAFVIRSAVGEELGQIRLQGSIRTYTADIDGYFQQHRFSLRFGLRDRHAIEGKKVQPYTVFLDDRESGAVFETLCRQSLFKSYSFHRLVLNGVEYDRFPIGMGEEGGKHPIYHGNHQVALIEKDAVVYNALHQYHVYAEDERAGFCAVLFACYMHVMGAYRAGEKVQKSVVKRVTYTREPGLLEKYDPHFKARIQALDRLT